MKATSKVGEPATAEDEEMKKRRARAERFGIPLVTPEQTQPVKETRRTPAGPKQSPAATAPNGKAAKTKVPKAAKPIEEVYYAIARREPPHKFFYRTPRS